MTHSPVKTKQTNNNNFASLINTIDDKYLIDNNWN